MVNTSTSRSDSIQRILGPTHLKKRIHKQIQENVCDHYSGVAAYISALEHVRLLFSGKNYFDYDEAHMFLFLILTLFTLF